MPIHPFWTFSISIYFKVIAQIISGYRVRRHWVRRYGGYIINYNIIIFTKKVGACRMSNNINK